MIDHEKYHYKVVNKV